MIQRGSDPKWLLVDLFIEGIQSNQNLCIITKLARISEVCLSHELSNWESTKSKADVAIWLCWGRKPEFSPNWKRQMEEPPNTDDTIWVLNSAVPESGITPLQPKDPWKDFILIEDAFYLIMAGAGTETNEELEAAWGLGKIILWNDLVLWLGNGMKTTPMIIYLLSSLHLDWWSRQAGSYFFH